MNAPLDRPETLANMYRVLWAQAAGVRHIFLAAFAFLLVSQLIMLAVPWLAGQAIDAIQQAGAGHLRDAGKWLALLLLATFASWLFHGPGRILERNVALAVYERLSNQLMERLFAAPLSWHQRHHSGETLHRVQQSTGALYDFAQSQYIYLQNTVKVFGPIIALWLISPLVGTVAIVGYGLLGGIILLFDRQMMRISVQENQADRRYSAALVDALGNVFSITALRRGAAVASLVAERLRATFAPQRKSILLNEGKWASVDLLSTLLWCVLVTLYAVLATQEAAAGTTSGVALGKVFMVYEYSQQAGGVITALAVHFQSLARHRTSIAAAQPIQDAPQGELPSAPQASGWHQLKLTGLTHAYHEADPPVLRDLQLELTRGRRYALIGASGSGKTSLMRVLAGLDRPTQGQLRLDGEEIPELSTRLRREATLIPQQAEIFEGSIADNLLLGAQAEPQVLDAALRASCIEAFVAAQPGGLDSHLAQGGANWSGGQRQRLALARGGLAAQGSSLVLLDEPTSSLDTDTEARLFQGFFDFFAGACLISSVHRLHLLDRFDQVILMEGGRVVDRGTPAELNARCGTFRALLAAQGNTPDSQTAAESSPRV